MSVKSKFGKKRRVKTHHKEEVDGRRSLHSLLDGTVDHEDRTNFDLADLSEDRRDFHLIECNLECRSSCDVQDE